MESEAISIDKYLDSDVSQRFEFLYENYSVLKAIIKDYREDIINDVIDMKSYNRRAANGELGVRVQVSMGTSNPTMNKAINNITIAKAVDEGYLDEDFFEDTDNPDELVKRVTIYHRVSIDYQSFTSKMATLNPKDQKILGEYLSGEKSFGDFSEEMGIDYQSAVKRVGRIKHKLIERVEPRLRRGA